jgi:hypothetical protein
MVKTFILIALSALLILLFLFLFVRPHHKALDVAEIEDIETEIKEINKIVSERNFYLELSKTAKDSIQIESCKLNIERLIEEYMLRKKLVENKISYLNENGIEYDFTKIMPINN